MKTQSLVASFFVLALGMPQQSSAVDRVPDQSKLIMKALNRFAGSWRVQSEASSPITKPNGSVEKKITFHVPGEDLSGRPQKGPMATVKTWASPKAGLELGQGYSGVAANYPVGSTIYVKGLGEFQVTRRTYNHDGHATIFAFDGAARGQRLVTKEVKIEVPKHLMSKLTSAR